MSHHLTSPQDLRIATPCQASWEQMTGDERMRFCDRCKQHVYNLSEMSYIEAVSFVRKQEGAACVRFYRRSDGTFLTRNCQDTSFFEGLRLAMMLMGSIAYFLLILIALAGDSNARDQYLNRLRNVKSLTCDDVYPAPSNHVVMGSVLFSDCSKPVSTETSIQKPEK
jgi:hypothetical protein